MNMRGEVKKRGVKKTWKDKWAEVTNWSRLESLEIDWREIIKEKGSLKISLGKIG